MTDLLDEFLDEAMESLSGLQGAFMRLAARPTAQAPLKDTIRKLHGLKGACGFLSLARAEALAHATESLVGALDGKPMVSPDAIALLGRALERLHQLIRAHAADGGEPAGDDADLIAPIEHLTAEMALRASVIRAPAPEAEIVAATLGLETIPVSDAWSGLAPFAVGLGEKLGKPVELILKGGATPISRDAAPALRAALITLIRNACDHGVETAAERVAAGKAACGHLQLSARAASGWVRVRLSDDGRGVPESLRRRIFTSGFSTAGGLDLVSGRGMGLSLVRDEMSRLGGRVSLASVPGRGATFILTSPAAAPAALRTAA